MAVIDAVEVWESRRSEETGDRFEGVTTHYREFLVHTSLTTDDGPVVLAAVAQRGTPHPNDPNAFLVSRSAINDREHRFVWHVFLVYSTEREKAINPLAEPARIVWTTAPYQRPYEKDRENNAILNSAGDKLIPALEGDDDRLIVRITKNVPASFASTTMTQFRNSINSEPVTIDGRTFDTKQCKIMGLSLSEVREQNGVEFRVFECEIAIDESPDGWTRKVLDAGFNKKVGAAPKEKIVLANGEDPTEPQLLDGSGNVTDTPFFLTFDIYKAMNFNDLPMT